MTIHMPNEQWPHWNPRVHIANSGGQRDPGNWPDCGSPRSFDLWLERYNSTDYHADKQGKDDRTSIHKVDWMGLETDNENTYTYLAVDLTRSYDSKKVKKYIREAMYIRPDYFFIFDKVRTEKDSYDKRWLLHCGDYYAPEKTIPVLNGEEKILKGTSEGGISESMNSDLIKITWGERSLLCKILLPRKSRLRKVGGKGYQLWIDDWDHPEKSGNWVPLNKYLRKSVEPGAWRLEIQPSIRSKNDYFLNVFYIPDSANDSIPRIELIESKEGNMVGSLENNHLILFGKTDKEVLTVTYIADSYGTMRHFICNLKAGMKYTITVNGEFLQEIRATKQGMISFTTEYEGMKNIKIVSE